MRGESLGGIRGEEGPNPVRRSIALLAWVFPFAAICGLPVPALAQRTVLEVIDLHYRNADEMLPVLRPLLDPGGTLSAHNNQLIVRTSPENLAQLRSVLDKLDRRPRRLIITVTQDEDRALQENDAALGIRSGNAAVPLPPGPGVTAGAGAARARVYSSRSAATDRTSRSVQVLEGGEAFVAAGESFPVRSTQIVPTPAGPRVADSTQYRDALSGFYARARVHGDNVTVEISSQSARRTAGTSSPGTVRQGVLETTVSGRLGEWIALGGAGQTRDAQSDSIVRRSSEAARDDRRLFLKVEEVQP